nr:radical SAM protein [Nanoarchaeota archaeon]
MIGKKQKIIPAYVNWELTNECNMGCPYCFLGENPEGVIEDMPTEKIRGIIRKLKENGVELINYAGGEPLIRKDIIELIGYGHDLGLKTILSTNGVLLNEKLIENLEGVLDWVSLPIDGYNSETHDSVRKRKRHFQEVKSLIEIIGNTKINLKINTMLCKKNIGYAREIADFLDNYNIKKWKLFQFSSRGKAKKIRKEYEISDKEFSYSERRIGKHVFDIVYSSNYLRDNAYFLIQTDGKVHVPIGTEYVYLGDLLKDEIIAFYKPELLSFEKNLENARRSYDYEEPLQTRGD